MKTKNMFLNNTLLVLLGIVISQTSFGNTVQHNDSTAKKKVVFILVDGIAADMLEKAKTPNLDAIATVGHYSKAYVGGKKAGYSETPTISAVGYNSMLTGTWANKHNVWGNSIKNPNYNYPTIFRILKDNHPQKQTAIFSTWLDNRTKLIGEDLAATDHIKMDYAFDGFELDTINFPHDKQRQYIKNIDEKVAQEAARYIKEEGPDLSWVYLEFSDDMGHGFGDSPQLYNAIEFEDALVGNIWKAVVEREKTFNEEWLVIITTDHGRSSEDGKGHGGQSDRERSTWIVTNAKNTNSYFKTQTPAIIDIMPTIQRFMHLNIPTHVGYEIDGIPFIGKVDVANLEATKTPNKQLKLRWKCISNPTKKATVLISPTNNHAKGGVDKYTAVGEVTIGDEEFIVPTVTKSNLYKIVLKAQNNTINTWMLKN